MHGDPSLSDLLNDEEVVRDIMTRAARFANFCQRFKLAVWKDDQFVGRDGKCTINEDKLDELAMIAWHVSSDKHL